MGDSGLLMYVVIVWLFLVYESVQVWTFIYHLIKNTSFAQNTAACLIMMSHLLWPDIIIPATAGVFPPKPPCGLSCVVWSSRQVMRGYQIWIHVFEITYLESLHWNTCKCCLMCVCFVCQHLQCVMLGVWIWCASPFWIRFWILKDHQLSTRQGQPTTLTSQNSY